MAKHFSALKIISALTLFSVATFACADVIRCEGGAGDVTYTDTDCRSGEQTEQLLLVDKPAVKNVTYQPPSKTVQGRSSNWANIHIAPRTGKVDKESVRSARLKMVSLDGTSRYVNAPR